MLAKIHLRNFMSHADTVVELGPGLNVLTGPNNSGKSAIVAALQILCRNEKSNYVVRHGETEASVTVETTDGHVVEWRRRKDSVRYTIDGKQFDRLRPGAVPEELHAVLKLPLVELERETIDIHFAAQKRPIFLLDGTESTAAQFFAASSDAILLIEMQKRHARATNEAKQERSRLEDESRQLSRELEALDPIEDLDRRLEEVERSFTVIADLERQIAHATQFAEQWQGHTREANRREALGAALASLADPPNLAPADPLAALADAIASRTREVERLDARARALKRVETPPELQPAEALSLVVGALRAATVSASTWNDRALALDALAAPPVQDDTTHLERLVREFSQWERQLATSERRVASLKALAEPPPPTDLSALERTLLALASANEEMADRSRRVAQLTPLAEPPPQADVKPLTETLANLDRVLDAVATHEREWDAACQAWSQADDVLRDELAGANCPTCGQPIDVQKMLDQVAVGGGNATSHDHD